MLDFFRSLAFSFPFFSQKATTPGTLLHTRLFHHGFVDRSQTTGTGTGGTTNSTRWAGGDHTRRHGGDHHTRRQSGDHTRHDGTRGRHSDTGGSGDDAGVGYGHLHRIQRLIDVDMGKFTLECLCHVYGLQSAFFCHAHRGKSPW